MGIVYLFFMAAAAVAIAAATFLQARSVRSRRGKAGRAAAFESRWKGPTPKRERPARRSEVAGLQNFDDVSPAGSGPEAEAAGCPPSACSGCPGCGSRG